MDKFLGLAVGKAHIGGLSGSIGDRTLRPGGNAGDPLFSGAREFRRFGAGGDGEHLAVLATGDQPVVGGIVESREQPVIGLNSLVAVIQPVDGSVGHGEMRDVAEEDGGDAMAF